MNMAGRPPELKNIKREFLEKIKSAKGFIKIFKEIAPVVKGSGKSRFNKKQKEHLLGLLFISIVNAWENFLEESLVRYLTGTTSGKYPIILKSGNKRTVSEARSELARSLNWRLAQLVERGDYDPKLHFISLSDLNKLLVLTDDLFSPNLYSVILSDIELLNRALAIRNRAAHNSMTSQQKFKETANMFLGKALTDSLSYGYSPGKFLIDPVKLLFGNYSLPDELSHFEAYLRMYETLANSIVPE
jgi:hypothetical protein